MVQLRDRSALRAPARYAETVPFSRLGTPIESTASPEPDIGTRRTLPPGTRPAFRLPIVDFNPNLPPAAFPTLGPNDPRPERNNEGNKVIEEEPMDIDESENASNSGESDGDVIMREGDTSGDDDDGEEAQPYEDGYEPEEFKVPEKIEWNDITTILRFEIIDNMSAYYESSEIMGILNLNARQRRELFDELTVIDRRIDLENQALEDMQKKQLKALLKIDNSIPRDDRVPGILVFKNIAKKYFKEPELKYYPDYLLSRASDVMIAREYLRRIGLDPDLAGEWSNGYAKIEMDPYGQGEERLRWIFDTEEKREYGIEQDTVKQLRVKKLPEFPGEGPQSRDPYLKSKLDFINCFGNAQSDPYSMVPIGSPVTKRVPKRGKEGHRSSHDTGVSPTTLGSVPGTQGRGPAHQHDTKGPKNGNRTTILVSGKEVSRRADGIPILRRHKKTCHSRGTSIGPVVASNGSSHQGDKAVPEINVVSGVAADGLASEKTVNSPATSSSSSVSKGYDLVRLSIGPDGAARTYIHPVASSTTGHVQSASINATVQPVANTLAVASQPAQLSNTGVVTDYHKDGYRIWSTDGAGARKKHKLPVKRLLAGAWFFHSTQENWKGPPKAPVGNRHEKVMAAQAEGVAQENQKALSNSKELPSKPADNSVGVSMKGDGNPLGQFRCFALPRPALRQEETTVDRKSTTPTATSPATGGQIGDSAKRYAAVPATQVGIHNNGPGPQLSTSMPPPPLPNRPESNISGTKVGVSQGMPLPNSSNDLSLVASDNITPAPRSDSQHPANGSPGKRISQPSVTGSPSYMQNGHEYIVGQTNVRSGQGYDRIPAAFTRPCILGTQQGHSYTYAQRISHMLLNPPPTCNPQEIMYGPREPAEQLQLPVDPVTSNEEGNEEGIHGDELMRDLEVNLEVPNNLIPGVSPAYIRDVSHGQETGLRINTPAVAANPGLARVNENGNFGCINGRVNNGQGVQVTEVVEPMSSHTGVTSNTDTQRHKNARKTTGQRPQGSFVVVSETSASVVVQNNSVLPQNAVVGMTDPPAAPQAIVAPIANAAATSQSSPKPRKKRVQNPKKKSRTAVRKRPPKVKVEPVEDTTGQ